MSGITFGNASGGGGGGGGGVLTALNNGLNIAGTTGQLGGPLVQVTSIDIAGFEFDIIDSVSGSAFQYVGGSNPSLHVVIDQGGDQAILLMQDELIRLWSNCTVFGNNGQVNLQANNADGTGAGLSLETFELILTRSNLLGQKQQINFNDNTGDAFMQVVDEWNNKGIEGAADFSGQYTSLSYVQQAWVLAQIAAVGGSFPQIKLANTLPNQTGDIGVMTYTPGGTGVLTMRLSVHVDLVSGTSGAITFTVVYTDTNDVEQTAVFPSTVLAGTTTSQFVICFGVTESNVITVTAALGISHYNVGAVLEAL